MMRSVRIAVNQLRRLKEVALGQVPAGRQMTVYPDDLFITSYPRSGNTWTRFLIGNLIYQDEPITFANVESRIPSIYIFPDRKLRRLPRVFKSHDCFDPRYRNVIYIVRDPRDVAVSAYHYSIKVRILDDATPIEQFLPLFMSGNFGSGLLTIPSWGCWYDNVASWLAMRHNRRFLLLRYEDLLEDARRELVKVADFLKIDPTPERLSRAISLSSAGRMRDLEKLQSGEWQLTKGTRADEKFVREAKSGNWRTVLSPECVSQIESSWSPLIEFLGYPLTTRSKGQGTFEGLAGIPIHQ